MVVETENKLHGNFKKNDYRRVQYKEEWKSQLTVKWPVYVGRHKKKVFYINHPLGEREISMTSKRPKSQI